MKYFLILALVFSSFSLSFGQSKDLLSVPILKESKKINQLMDIVLDPKNADEYDRDKTSTDSCFFILLLKSEGHISFQVEKKTKSVTNEIANRCIVSKNFGCFLYKKYKIFVFAVNGFYDFFDTTDERRNFDFVYKLKSSELGNVEDYLAIWHYQYKDGNFSVEGPPAIK